MSVSIVTPDQLTLQERVRRFNLGTPTALHVGTYELVNDLWQTHVVMLAALRDMLKHHGNPPNLPEVIKAHRAIAKATGEA